ncbi:MAG: hypothetical protein ABIP51_10050 [Bacteroidia bacterium]
MKEESPELIRLNESLRIWNKFEKEVEEEVSCPGCKICLYYKDIENVLMRNKPPEFMDKKIKFEIFYDEMINKM